MIARREVHRSWKHNTDQTPEAKFTGDGDKFEGKANPNNYPTSLADEDKPVQGHWVGMEAKSYEERGLSKV